MIAARSANEFHSATASGRAAGLRSEQSSAPGDCRMWVERQRACAARYAVGAGNFRPAQVVGPVQSRPASPTLETTCGTGCIQQLAARLSFRLERTARRGMACPRVYPGIDRERTKLGKASAQRVCSDRVVPAHPSRQRAGGHSPTRRGASHTYDVREPLSRLAPIGEKERRASVSNLAEDRELAISRAESRVTRRGWEARARDLQHATASRTMSRSIRRAPQRGPARDRLRSMPCVRVEGMRLEAV